MKITRELYVKSDWEKISLPDGLPVGTECWLYGRNVAGSERFGVCFFLAKQNKPYLYRYFYTIGQRQEAVNSLVRGLLAAQSEKAARRDAKKAAVCPFKVGDILHGSWGYDQTNVEFWRVTAVQGRKLTIQECKHEVVPGSEGYLCEHVTPGETFGPEIVKIAQTRNGRDWYVKLDTCRLTVFTGGSAYASHYA